jgi:hypothetical protein
MTRSSCRFLLIGILLPAISTTFSYALTENDCPVCFSIVNKLRADLEKDSTKLTVDNISTAFLHLCDTASKDSTESKFCYYMGGQDVSATRTYKEMAEKMSWGLPTDKICEHLKSRDSQICEIREKKPIDLKTVDLKKLKVADLKRILKERGDSCDGCFEKAEFIKKVEEIKAREEL